MAVRVLIKRRIKAGKLNEASKLITQARYNAMDQPGYISSETLTECDDPNRVLVVSMWQRLENWNAYVDSEVRKSHEERFAEMLDGSTVVEAYHMGLQSG